MRKYELLLLFSPELTAENRQEITENLTNVLAREQGSMLELDDWGMRDLAYPVQKKMRGHYTRYEFAAPATAIAELERIIRITDGIMKFITVKLEDKFEAKEEA
ncbi:30S ribosomal protein S6 [Desulfovibrio inopinatus]|uniref:30S ribosomal protein S6 n=1 Tax=Desulfovibrio inopinatus TaxID=102109 RepID=UPI00041170B5|nr:30S ribosomal protein S6 [Desulfovibrio inopinatus]